MGTMTRRTGDTLFWSDGRRGRLPGRSERFVYHWTGTHAGRLSAHWRELPQSYRLRHVLYLHAGWGNDRCSVHPDISFGRVWLGAEICRRTVLRRSGRSHSGWPPRLPLVRSAHFPVAIRDCDWGRDCPHCRPLAGRPFHPRLVVHCPRFDSHIPYESTRVPRFAAESTLQFRSSVNGGKPCATPRMAGGRPAGTPARIGTVAGVGPQQTLSRSKPWHTGDDQRVALHVIRRGMDPRRAVGTRE